MGFWSPFDPLSDGAGAKDRIDCDIGSFDGDSASLSGVLNEDAGCRTEYFRRQHRARRERRARMRELIDNFVRLH